MASAKTFEEYLLTRGEVGDRFRSLWRDMIHKLEEAGYNGDSWCRAAHIVWCAEPKKLRVPHSEAELAELLGKHEKTLRNWRYADRNAEVKLYATGAESVRRLLNEWLPDVMYAAYDMAVNGGKDGAADRRLLAAAAGIATANTDITSGGAPLKSYTVLASPDDWDSDGHLEAATVANPAVAG